MTQFLKVKSAGEVLEIIRNLEPLDSEVVDLHMACGRVLYSAVAAREPVPHFNRAVMDGFAVRARDTFGATESLPALLEIVGDVAMGKATSLVVSPGKAISVPTGGMLPDGADAVVMVEYTYPLDDKTIEVTKPVAPGDNILMAGEDIRPGDDLFPAGCQLRPQDIGAIAALGITSVTVYRKPTAAVFSTGDEIVPIYTDSVPLGKVRDINSYSLSCQIEMTGVSVGAREVIEDDLQRLVTACRSALEKHDVLILSGGSSVGTRDFTLQILDSFPDAEVLVHGVAVRPGKPTILARIGRKIFWGLPGQPMSALMICKSFVIPSLYSLQGLKDKGPSESLSDVRTAILGRQLPSVHGRTDYVPVVITKSEEGMVVNPVFGKSAMISTLAKSDGYVVVPEHVEGLDHGTTVSVHLFKA